MIIASLRFIELPLSSITRVSRCLFLPMVNSLRYSMAPNSMFTSSKNNIVVIMISVDWLIWLKISKAIWRLWVIRFLRVAISCSLTERIDILYVMEALVLMSFLWRKISLIPLISIKNNIKTKAYLLNMKQKSWI